MLTVTFPTRVVITEQLTTEAILGLDILADHECTVRVGKNILCFPNHGIASHPSAETRGPSQTGVTLVETVCIPAFSELEVMGETQDCVEAGCWGENTETR